MWIPSWLPLPARYGLSDVRRFFVGLPIFIVCKSFLYTNAKRRERLLAESSFD